MELNNTTDRSAAIRDTPRVVHTLFLHQGPSPAACGDAGGSQALHSALRTSRNACQQTYERRVGKALRHLEWVGGAYTAEYECGVRWSNLQTTHRFLCHISFTRPHVRHQRTPCRDDVWIWGSTHLQISHQWPTLTVPSSSVRSVFVNTVLTSAVRSLRRRKRACASAFGANPHVHANKR